MSETIVNKLQQRHGDQKEFIQAVLEFLEDVWPLYLDRQDWQEARVIDRLVEPDRTIKFRVTWRDTDGEIQVNQGLRVQFNQLLGAYKGGLRFDPSVNESILKFLGFEQSFKNALTQLPMGGAKGGSDFNPKGRSHRDIESFCYAFMQELYRHIGPETDIPAGDMGVGSREIGYLFGQYVKLKNQVHGSLSGKDPIYGGSLGREEATGYGLIFFVDEALKKHGESIEGKKVLLSGAGNVALHAGEKLIEKGARVLSFSDSGGTIYFSDGISKEDFELLKKSKLQDRKRLKELSFKGSAEFREGKKPWTIEANIALPCATQNELNASDAKNLLKNKVELVGEGANMPLTDESVALLNKKIIYLPGKAANAGGVIVSGFERSQNSQFASWSSEEVCRRLEEIMVQVHQVCVRHAPAVQEGESLNYKAGANRYAFQKLAEVMLHMGAV